MASSIKSWGVTVYLLTSGMPASGFEDRINMGGRVSSTSWSNMKFRTCACCDSDSLRTFTCSDSSSPGYPRVKAVKRGCCCYYVNILLDVRSQMPTSNGFVKLLYHHRLHFLRTCRHFHVYLVILTLKKHLWYVDIA